MTEKITKAIIKVSALTLIATVILIIGVLYEHFTQVLLLQQKNELSIASRGVVLLGKEYFEGLNTKDYRITWIDQEGKVLFDSKADANKMENHLDRKEIKDAIETGQGVGIRNSQTLSEKTFYSAMRLEDNTVLRISSTQLSAVSLLLGVLQPICVIIFTMIIIAYVLARRVSKKAVEPLNNIDLDNPLENQIYDELAPLLSKIDRQNKKIDLQLEEMNRINKEITYVTENVSDGIIMLNNRGRVISANKKAKQIFNIEEKAFYLDFCRDMTYKKTVSDALIGKESFCILKIQAAVYRVYANSIATENNSFAVFLFLKDVTEEENAQQMRREFTANVSHELKTPLTAIMGSAEIIESGIAKNEDIVLFASKIREESKRLLELIKDIIKLSRLDEGSIPQEFSDIDLLELCEEIKKELSLKLEEKSISLQICSDNSKIYGIKPVVHEIIFNLCDNAVNYNKVNGAVFVKTEKNGNWIDVSVKDSGMGIPDEDLPHIFERFYTADKSHSKERGGTGLGLSIVKHGALLHKAKITAQSVLGKGTTITVSFPNKELFNTL